MTPFRPFALVVGAFLCLFGAASAGAGSVGLPAWGTEPTPNAGFPRNVLSAVDTDGTSAWAVGYYEAAGYNHPRPLAERWNGTAWTQVEVPWDDEGELLGVAVVAADDVWLVGGNQSGGQALIAHWNGTSLSLVPHPNPGAFNRLYAVTAVSADDVWAVGEFTDPISKTFVLHWDGSSWTHVPSPTGEGYNQLNGVAAVAADDVWAVGEDGTSTLTLHWDGTDWSRVPAPSPGFSATLRAVSASATGDVWAVGDSGPDPLVLHWSGSAWDSVPSPSPGNSFLDLTGVVALSPTEAWAVGVHDVVGGSWRTLTMRWNGTDWSQVSSPSPDPSLNALSAVAALGPDLVAVGWARSTGTLALRWSSGSWTRQPSENAGVGSNVLNGISAGSASDIWAVGHAQEQSLTLHYDGAAWSVVPSPNREFGIRLEDVVTIGPNDAWAVGWSGSASSFDDESAALHWNGKVWTVVPTPQPGGAALDRLLAVDAVGPNDVWATGLYSDEAINNEYSVILHWDGTSWSVVPHDCDTWGGLTGVTTIGATDAWAVGNATTCHYDGTAWTEVPSPQPRIEYYEIAYPLEDVSAAATSDVWAVGARVLDDGWQISWNAFAEHWDGESWAPVYAVPGQLLLGVEALAPNDVYAVGTNGYGPLIVRYDGTSWSTIPTPEAGRGGRLAGIDAAADGPSARMPLFGGNLWAAGDYNPGYAGERTLIQHAPSATQGAVVGDTNVAYATVSWFGPENGSTSTNPYGDFEVGGLQSGTYTFTATEPFCVPDSRTVTVRAGETIQESFHIDCGGRPRSKRIRGRLLGKS